MRSSSSDGTNYFTFPDAHPNGWTVRKPWGTSDHSELAIEVEADPDTDDEELAAGFQQNSLQRVRAGDEAEVAFDALPGHIVKGKVKHVIDAIATGQLQATGGLQDMGSDIPSGRAVAIIDIEDDTSAYNLPGGAEAQVAVYTPFAHHFAIIRRILLRMKSWQNFVFLEGH